MSNQPNPTKNYCNCLAQERGLNPIGHAGSFDDAIIIETPLPWKESIIAEADPLPQQAIDLLELWFDRYRQTGQYRHRPLVIAPDEAYSREGHRRVMFYRRPAGAFAHFEKTEFLVPVEHLGPLVWALFEDHDALPDFDTYRVPEADTVRDVLVCTHGTIDAACAKFGFPLYRHLRDTHADDSLRVWRVSHFGGHVFAPTLMDMPTGHYWAYVDETVADAIVGREGDVATLAGHYRGWAGVEHGFQQVVDYVLWQEHGWEWFGVPRTAETLDTDNSAEKPNWADVRVRYAPPGHANEMVFEGRVEVSHTVSTPPSTDSKKQNVYPQYRLTKSVVRAPSQESRVD